MSSADEIRKLVDFDGEAKQLLSLFEDHIDAVAHSLLNMEDDDGVSFGWPHPGKSISSAPLRTLERRVLWATQCIQEMEAQMLEGIYIETYEELYALYEVAQSYYKKLNHNHELVEQIGQALLKICLQLRYGYEAVDAAVSAVIYSGLPFSDVLVRFERFLSMTEAQASPKLVSSARGLMVELELSVVLTE